MTPEEGTLVGVSRALGKAVDELSFGPPVTHVYNPLDYAWRPHSEYLERYGRAPKEVVLVGMNPGPFGMAQTGVPFGAVEEVRGWLDIEGVVDRPRHEHPKRPIRGFEIDRNEVSGARLWAWAAERFETPEGFFERFFVANYCPLCFMEESGRNRTPDKLPREERDPLFAHCDEALRQTVRILAPRWVVGVGRFAERRVRVALDGLDLRIGMVLHPSPASPRANQGWAPQADAQLEALGIDLP